MPGCIFFFCQHLGTFLLRNGNPWLSVYLSIILILSTTLSCVTDKELQKCLVGWRGNLVLPLHLSWTSIGTCWYTKAPPLVPRAWVINRSLFHWEGGANQFGIKEKKKKKPSRTLKLSPTHYCSTVDLVVLKMWYFIRNKATRGLSFENTGKFNYAYYQLSENLCCVRRCLWLLTGRGCHSY